MCGRKRTLPLLRSSRSKAGTGLFSQLSVVEPLSGQGSPTCNLLRRSSQVGSEALGGGADPTAFAEAMRPWFRAAQALANPLDAEVPAGTTDEPRSIEYTTDRQQTIQIPLFRYSCMLLLSE